MAAEREPAWSEHEKVALLAELLKAAPIRSEILLRLVQEYHIVPRWADIPLPPGRSLNSCRHAFDSMLAAQIHEYPRPGPGPGPAPLTTILQGPATDPARKRPFPFDITTPLGRSIQPRPSYMPPGDVSGGSPYAPVPASADEHGKRRRGRPTKAEAQAKAEAAWARGETYPPVRTRKADRPAASVPQENVIGPLSLPRPVTSAPVAPMATATATAPATVETPRSGTFEPESEPSSAGKKRRSRPSTAEQKEEEGQRGAGVDVAEAGRILSPRGKRAPHPSDIPPTPPVGPAERRPSPVTEMREGLARESEEIRQNTTTPRSFKETVGM